MKKEEQTTEKPQPRLARDGHWNGHESGKPPRIISHGVSITITFGTNIDDDVITATARRGNTGCWIPPSVQTALQEVIRHICMYAHCELLHADIVYS